MVDIYNRFIAQTEIANSVDDVNKISVEFLGKKGLLNQQFALMGKMSVDEKKEFGARLNQIRDQITEQIQVKLKFFQEKEVEARIISEKLDVTLPVYDDALGSIHPISFVKNELEVILQALDFFVVEGPEIEDDFHNFTALNIDENHPARDMHDTFYVGRRSNDDLSIGEALLRTHTSSVQIRAMKEMQPPFRIISAGKTFRSDSDSTHTPMFHQLEALCVDQEVNIANLKFVILYFLKEFFQNDDIHIRFRSNFFPFTEPSFEVDIGYSKSNGVIKIGGQESFMEIMGCGMVHPNVLKNVDIDPNIYQGFAFGVGIERLAMLKYGISDLRQFYVNDNRWLQHYGFSATELL